MESIRIHVMHTGTVCVDPALPFKSNSKNPIAFTGIGRNPRNRLWLPVSSYLIEHPKGLILFDTGWHREVAPYGEYNKIAQIRHMYLRHYLLNQAMLPTGKAIDEQLAERSIKPEDLDYVILSHLHTDHASGLRQVKNAKKVLVSKTEMDDAFKYPIRYAKGMWDGVKIDTFEFSQTGKGPVGMSYDLYGDGSIELINIPGHTNGLAAMKINNNGRYVLLFSDGGYAEKSWKQLIAPGTALDKNKAMNSIMWIKEVSVQKECIESLANHDPDIIPHEILV